MACFDPRSTAGFFSLKKEMPDPKPTTLPCGQCIGCRVDKAREWSIRLQHEAQTYEESFDGPRPTLALTLTYETPPPGNSLNKTDIRNFFKRLRKNSRQKIRYYQCGEYGDQNLRPHHHAIIFGLSVDDAKLWKRGKSDQYVSPFLTETWGHGFVTFGLASPAAMGYVAGYVTKKLREDPNGLSRLDRVDPTTGETWQVLPEFATMSRGRGFYAGIGSRWFHQYWRDVYPEDVVTYRSRNKMLQAKPPKYYDILLERHHPEVWDEVKAKRQVFTAPLGERTTQRLTDKATCLSRKLQPRDLPS